METHTQEDPYDLELAIVYWQYDQPLPLDIASRLLAYGYDVEKLEEKYRP